METKEIGFLFDLDGVLIDSESKYSEIWEKIERLYPTGIENFALTIKGTTLPDILGRYFTPMGVRDEVESLLYELEGKMEYEYCQGAENLLCRLREEGVKCAIVTSSDHVKMNHLFSQHPELRDMVDTVVMSDDVTRSKPDPEGYLLAAERLGLSPSKCIVVEDSLQGMVAGNAAGCKVIGVDATIGKEATKANSDIQVSNVGEIRIEDLIL